jgi:hypothetical protein
LSIRRLPDAGGAVFARHGDGEIPQPLCMRGAAVSGDSGTVVRSRRAAKANSLTSLIPFSHEVRGLRFDVRDGWLRIGARLVNT